MLLGMLILQESVVCVLENISRNSWHLTKSNIKTLIRSFWKHVPTMPNDYCLWLPFFLLKYHHKNISHDLTNKEYGLHILSLIWHLLPCSNVLLLTIYVIALLHLFAWNYCPIIAFAIFLDFCTLYKQPTLFWLTWMLIPIWYFYSFNVLLPLIC